MNSKRRKTLAAIFAKPTNAHLRWSDIVSLVLALGGEVEERAGSRVMFIINGVGAVFHSPHPERIAGKAVVDGLRNFLRDAGVEP